MIGLEKEREFIDPEFAPGNRQTIFEYVGDGDDETVKPRSEVRAKKAPVLKIPIRFQLSVAVFLIIVTAVSMLSMGMLKRQRKQLYDQTVKIGMVTLNHFENNAAIPLLENNSLSLNNLLKESTSVEGILYSFILNTEGRIVAHTDLKKIGETHRLDLERITPTSENGTTYFSCFLPSGEHVLNLTKPVDFSEKILGEVHVGVSIDFIEDEIGREKNTLFAMTFFILALGTVSAFMFGHRFSKPISRLVEATREIGRGNYEHRVRTKRKDEFGDLARAFNHMGEELWAKALMKESFGKYVGNEILEMILTSPEKNWLKGDKNEATVVFADIRGFTSYSENRDPERVVDELNEFFEIATEIISKHGGYVDKFIGDAVLGVFGVPVRCDDHEMRAVRACLEMAETLRTRSKNGNLLLPSAAFSVETGLVVSGNIGSQARMEYTVIGDAVNLASRINAFAKAGEVIAGSSVYEKLGDRLRANPLAPVIVKGKARLVRTYKVLGVRSGELGVGSGEWGDRLWDMTESIRIMKSEIEKGFPGLIFRCLLLGLVFYSCAPGAGRQDSEYPRKELEAGRISSILRETDDFVFVRPGKFDTFETIASEYLLDPGKGWLIAKFNDQSEIVPGRILAVPLNPVYPGGFEGDGYQTVPILAYHCFSEDRPDKMTVSAGEFERQMRYMKENGYRTISLEELLDFMEFKAPVPERSFLVTIDDGWESSYRIAFPILRKYGFTAAYFVHTDFIGGKGRGLSWSQLKEMSDRGFEIQNHTRSHRNLTVVGKGETYEQYLQAAIEEILDAEEVIERHIGMKPRYFAYPYGETNDLVTSVIKKLGYRAAFTVERGSAPFFENRYKIRRSVIYGDYDLTEFANNISFREAFSANDF